MTNENNSFRITAHGDKATVWKISDYFYSVLYDSAKEPVAVKTDWVEQHLNDGDWVKVEFELMPTDVFADKFEDILCRQTEDALYTSQPSPGGYSRDPDYSIGRDADKLIAEYTKAVEYIEGQKVTYKDKVGEISFKLNIDTSEAQVAIDDLVEKSNTVLERIKSFTTGTGHDVFVTEGIYKVYRAHEDMPYVAKNEEELIKIIDALVVLDNAETE